MELANIIFEWASGRLPLAEAMRLSGLSREHFIETASRCFKSGLPYQSPPPEQDEEYQVKIQYFIP